MAHYIDADRLKTDIERRRLSNRYIDTEGYESELIDIIDSLQQEQKPAGRSKEDSNIAEELYGYFWHLKFKSDKDFSPSLSFDDVLEWLKSLRPKPSWKPSDEQLRPLEYAIDYFKKKRNDTTYLESLYNDLKKL